MSPLLLEAGYIQVGNPFFPNYDPVCLAPSESGREGAVVQLDHEMISQHGADSDDFDRCTVIRRPAE